MRRGLVWNSADDRLRDLQHRLRAGDRSAGPAIIQELVRRGRLQPAQVEILACLDDPYALATGVRCDVNHLLFREPSLRVSRWLEDLQLLGSERWYGDLVIAVAYSLFQEADRPVLDQENPNFGMAIDQFVQHGRNRFRRGSGSEEMQRIAQNMAGVAREMVDRVYPGDIEWYVHNYMAEMFAFVITESGPPHQLTAPMSTRLARGVFHETWRRARQHLAVDIDTRQATPLIRRLTRNMLHRWWIPEIVV